MVNEVGVCDMSSKNLLSLGDVASELVQQASPTSDFIYVDISSIDRETKRIVNAKKMIASEAPSRAKQVLRSGDVLISMTRPNLNAVAIVPRHLDGAIGSTGFHVLRSRWIKPEFLFGLVQSDDFIDAMCDVVQGALYPAVRPKDIATFTFVLQSPKEQTRIVQKLEELLSDLDAGVAELKLAQKKLGQYRQSLLKAAVEGALTAEWRASNTPLETGAQLLERILTERRSRWEAKQLAKFKEQCKVPPKDWREKYPAPAQADTSDLAELPEGWVWASVEQLGSVQLGRQRSPSKVGKANPTPYIRAANVTEGGVDLSDVLEMDFSETEKETFALKVGDVLLTEASGSPEHVGRPAVWTKVEGLYCFQNTVLRFSPKGIGSEYAFYSFLAMQKLGVFSRLSGGVGINHLSAGKFSLLPVPLPPVAEQLALTESIKESFSRCDDQLIFNSHALKQSTAQRQNILRAAFAGQLLPQDPNDEPASVMLARIQAERSERDAVKKPRGRRTKELA